MKYAFLFGGKLRHHFLKPLQKEGNVYEVVQLKILPMYANKPEASAFLGQQLCTLALLRYHLWQTVHPYIWLCVTLLCRGLAFALAVKHRAHWHDCTSATTTVHQRKETCTVCAANTVVT